jgi:hypothetical protein
MPHAPRWEAQSWNTFSFIRTMTVGPGITPDLLTLARKAKALAGLRTRPLTAGGDFHPALRIEK